MNCTQNERICQVTEETIVIGVDIAHETHYASSSTCINRTLRMRGWLTDLNTDVVCPWGDSSDHCPPILTA
jgi:hypothetical protein